MPTIEWNRRWGEVFAGLSSEAKRRYGLQWGDPDRRVGYWMDRLLPFRRPRAPGPLYKVVDQYITPYLRPDATVLEIGCGGGRWTKYLVGARKLICVDINDEFFEGIQLRFPKANIQFHKSAGSDLRTIEDSSVDFVFSFGTFVHIEPERIRGYLSEVQRVLVGGGVAVVHYAEKSKPEGRKNAHFSDMTARKMEDMVTLGIVQHDVRLLNHSNIIVMEKPRVVAVDRTAPP